MAPLWSGRSSVEELSEEMEFHILEKADALEASGLSPDEAMRAARRSFGDQALLQDRSEDVWSDTFRHRALTCLRFASVQLRREPLFVAVCILILGLGIRANTAIFTGLYHSTFRKLPVSDPNRLVFATIASPAVPGIPLQLSMPLLSGLDTQHTDLSSLSGWMHDRVMAPDASGEQRSLSAMLVTVNAFDVLGVRPAAGRLLLPEDAIHNPAKPWPVVLSDSYWSSRYHRSPAAIGEHVMLSGHEAQIVGVAPYGFDGITPNVPVEMYLPMAFYDLQRPTGRRDPLREPGYLTVTAVGRLRDGVAIHDADLRLDQSTRTWLQQQMASLVAGKARLDSKDPETLRWGRQVVWVLMAHALWHHRNNRLAKMTSTLDVAEELLRSYLVCESRDFYGTFARLNFYRGLQLRDQGDFEAATTRFQDSFESAQQRRLEMLKNRIRLEDPKTKQIEEIFAKCCAARVQAYGFGEIAFLRGDLAGSLTWFRTALSTLEGQGIRRWQLSIESYLQGSTVLISPFSQDGAAKIREARKRLIELASALETEHKGYSELAHAFCALGTLRLEQIRLASENLNTLMVTLLDEVVQHVCELRPSKFQDGHGEDQPVRRNGAVSALISLLCGEVLLRSGRHADCMDEVNWLRKRFDNNGFVRTEADLLNAQLHIAAVEPSRALSFLEHHGHGLLDRSNRNQQALWFALAAIVAIDVDASRPLSGRLFAERAASLNSRVRHGFVNHLVQSIGDKVSQQRSGIFAMPYQNVPPDFSLEANEESAVRNLLRAASAAHPGASKVDDFCELLGRKKSTLYKGRYKKYIDELLDELRRGRPKKRSHGKKTGS